MTPDPPTPRSTRPPRGRRPRHRAAIAGVERRGHPGRVPAPGDRRDRGPERRDHRAASAASPDAELPVMSSGSPQAEIMLVKWSASLAERQEGVAFFGRAGTAILKSVQRLGIDPLQLYGTLCVKCTPPRRGRGRASCACRGSTREIHIVQPKLIVADGRARGGGARRPRLPAGGAPDAPSRAWCSAGRRRSRRSTCPTSTPRSTSRAPSAPFWDGVPGHRRLAPGPAARTESRRRLEPARSSATRIASTRLRTPVLAIAADR